MHKQKLKLSAENVDAVIFETKKMAVDLDKLVVESSEHIAKQDPKELSAGGDMARHALAILTEMRINVKKLRQDVDRLEKIKKEKGWKKLIY